MESRHAISVKFMERRKLFLSGFGPFLEIKNNPSEILVKKLSEHFSCAHVILPVLFEDSFSLLKSAVLNIQPEILIMFGVASTRSKICLEKVGLNWVQSTSADVGRKIPTTGKIKPAQDLALMSNWSFEPVLRKLDSTQTAHIELSFSAGAYVCNDLYFRVLDDKTLNCEKLFIHIPPFEKIDLQLQFEIIAKFVEMTLQD